MEKLKMVFDFSIVLFLYLSFSPHCIAENYSDLLIRNSSDSNFTCFLEMIPLQYEISIGPVKNSSDLVRVLCWVKIKAQIGENDCRATNNKSIGAYVNLNSRNCSLDFESLTVSKIVFGEQKEVLNTEIKSFENIGGFLSVPNKYIFQFEMNKVKAGDQILFELEYQLDLKRVYFSEPWQGLYYYDPKDNNGTELFNYFPLHAKYMFPVLETFNPIHKPTFKVSVARHKEFASVSNTEIEETAQIPELDEGWVIDYFRESPPMKIDQVTLLILRGFQNHTIYQNNFTNNIEYRRTTKLWTFENQRIKNETIYYTLFAFQNIMDFYDVMFNQTKYPLENINFIVVPWNTFGSSGIKGNLGFVTTMKYTLSHGKEYVGENQFMAREIALQWFSGIAPSVNEYKESWLSSEALAYYVISWMTPPGPIWVDPLYALGDSYVLDMTVLLQMMEQVVSREIIQYAVGQIYLPKAASQGTYPSNFWNAIQKSIEFHNETHVLPYADGIGTVTVADVFNSWIDKQYQYPIIRINDVQNCPDSIELYQEIPKDIDLKTNGLWWVPVNITTKNGNALIWISPSNTENSSIIYQNSDLIDTKNGYTFVSPNLTEYYDVNYSNELMKRIINQLNINHLVISKDLITKQFYLIKTANTWNTLEMGLEMTKYLGKEMDFDIWIHAFRAMIRFNGKFLSQPSSFQIYFGSKVNQVSQMIGVSPNVEDNANTANLRQQLLQISYLYEVPLLIQLSTNLLTQWMENTTVNPFSEKVSSEMRQGFLCAAVGNSSDNSAFHFLYEKLANYNLSVEYSNSWIEAKQICKALTCVRDDDLLDMLLRSDSKLAYAEHRLLQTCYQQYIPLEILWRRPLTMRKSVQDFWLKYNVKENQVISNQTGETSVLIPWFHEHDVFVELVQFYNLKDHAKFTANYFSGMMSISWMPIGEEGFDDIYKKSEKWFDKNL